MLQKHSSSIALTWAAALSALALLPAGCQKNDPVPTTADRLKSVAQRQETQPDFFAPRKSVDYMASLKNFKDAPAPAPAPVPAKAEAPKPAAPEVVPAKAPAPAPVAAAPVVQQAPAPVVVASAAPTARPIAPPAESAQTVTVLKREQPDFPRDAIRAGVESGTVRAKLTIAANGDVTNVVIVSSNPPRVFDRAVRASLERWKFNAGAEGRSYETEIGFKVN